MGTKIGSLDIDKLFLGSTSIDKIYLGTEEIYSTAGTAEPLCFTAEAATSIAFIKNGSTTGSPALKYKINDGSWTDYTFGNLISLNISDNCYWKGNNNTFSESEKIYIQFTSTGTIAASGNIMSIVDETAQTTVIPQPFFFHKLFYECTSLTQAPALPATTLTSNCYREMFSGCTALQVSDTQTSVAPYAWRIPTSGTFTNPGNTQLNMFYNCLGTRSTNDLSAAFGENHIYYTQNATV